MYASLRDLLDEAKDELQESKRHLSQDPSDKVRQENVRHWEKEIEEIEFDIRFESSGFNV